MGDPWAMADGNIVCWCVACMKEEVAWVGWLGWRRNRVARQRQTDQARPLLDCDVVLVFGAVQVPTMNVFTKNTTLCTTT